MQNILKEIKINNKPGKEKPVYEQVAMQIREKIESFGLVAGMRLPAISEMMKEWKIGYPTINTALDILEKDELIRREPGRGKGPLVLDGGVAPKILKFSFHRWCNEAQFLNIEKGIRSFTSDHGCKFRVIDSTASENHYGPELIIAESEGLDGMIFYPMDREDYLGAVKRVIANGVKVVFVDRYFPELDISSVCIDNFSGGYQATMHLIEEQNCPVYYFGNTGRPSSSHSRHQGWYQAMREHFSHIPFEKEFLWELPLPEGETTAMQSSEWERFEYESALKYIKSVKQDRVCVFCVNDDAANIMMNAASNNGREVGKDFFVVGFGNKPYCERLSVPFSSVSQYDDKVGYEAAKLLYSMIENPSLRMQRITRTLSVNLEVRASSVMAS